MRLNDAGYLLWRQIQETFGISFLAGNGIDVPFPVPFVGDYRTFLAGIEGSGMLGDVDFLGPL